MPALERGGPRRSVLLNGLPADELRRVEDRLETVTVPAGTVLLAQGVWQGTLYLVRSGVLQVQVRTEEGETRELAKLAPGECVGEMSLLTGMPASATVTALTDATVQMLQHVDFVELLGSSPALAQNVSVMLSRRLATTLQREETGFNRIMRIRAPPDVPPGLTLQIARLAARYLATPSLTLDTRASPAPAEHVPLPDLLVRAGRENFSAETMLVARPGRLSPEDWARLEGAVSPRVPNVVLIVDVEDRSSEGWGVRADADILLWPEVAGRPPANADVVLLVSGSSRNTRAALDQAASRTGARVVRMITPEDDGDLGWVARHLAGLKVGLTLGGGGARGSAHIGILQAVERAGVPIDFLSGCSVGAGLAAGYANGLTIPELTEMLRNFAGNVLRYTVPRYSLLSNKGLESFFRKMVGDRTLEELDIPLAIVAADVLRAQAVVLDRGLIWKAVLASTALPGIYPPIWIGEHCLVDGGVVDPVPAEAARGLGADVVLAARLSKAEESDAVWAEAVDSPSGESPMLLQTLQRSFDVMAEEISERSVKGADVVISVRSDPLTIREFREGTRLIPAGESALERSWPRIGRILPWLRDVPFPTAKEERRESGASVRRPWYKTS